MKMNCPDPDRLAELPGDRLDGLELHAHAQSCDNCRAAVRLIREIQSAFRPGPPVSDDLVRRALAGIERAGEPRPPSEPQNDGLARRDPHDADTPCEGRTGVGELPLPTAAGRREDRTR
jgi:hypothetical protein